MVRQNKRSGGIDFLSVEEGGTGHSSLGSFIESNGFISKEDPRVIKISESSGGSPTIKLSSLNDLSVIRPILTGPTKANPGETVSFLVKNKDISINYSVSSDDGDISYKNGIVYFTVTNSTATKSSAKFKVNGFEYSVNIESMGPISGSVLLSGVKLDNDMLRLVIAATEFSSNTGSSFVSIKYEIATDPSFSNIIYEGASFDLDAQIDIPLNDVYYVRMAYVDSDGVQGNWFYSEPAKLSDFETNISSPRIVGALTTEGNSYRLHIRGSKFISKFNTTLESMEIEMYGDINALQFLNSSVVTTNKPEISLNYSPLSDYVYIRARYSDVAGNTSDWSNMIRLNIAGAYSTNPISEIQKIPDPYQSYRSEFGTFVRVTKDGKYMAITSFRFPKDGVVTIFRREKNTWKRIQTLTYTGPQTTSKAQMGYAITFSNDSKSLFIGAPGGGQYVEGIIFVYVLDEQLKEFSLRDTIYNPKATASYHFGSGIIVSDDGNKLLTQNRLYAGMESPPDLPEFNYYEYEGNQWVLKSTVPVDAVFEEIWHRDVMGTGYANANFDKFFFATTRDSTTGSHYYYKLVNGVPTLVQKIDNTYGNTVNHGWNICSTLDLSMIVIGANAADSNTGQVRIYRYNQTTDRYDFDVSMSLAVNGSEYGWDVDVDSTGTRILSGARIFSESRGMVDLLQYIDNGWRLVNRYTASDMVPGEEFGISVKFDEANDEVVIGANGYSSEGYGSVYVYAVPKVAYTDYYTVPGSDRYETLNIFNAPANSTFGAYIHISDDGKKLYTRMSVDDTGNYNANIGSVIEFENISGTWVELNRIFSPNTSFTNFGDTISVTADDQWMAVGAPMSSISPHTGRVCIFRREANSWRHHQTISASLDTWDIFGISLIFNKAGTRLFVGAPRGQNLSAGTSNNRGAVYIFKLNGDNWVEDQVLINDIAVPESIGGFGRVMDISQDGNIFIAGASDFRVNGVANGLVKVFKYDQATDKYIKNADLTTVSNLTASSLGRFVKISPDGKRIFATARYEPNGDIPSVGCVYVWRNDNGVWNLESRLYDSEIYADSSFGARIACNYDGSLMVAGNIFSDGNRGHVNVYKRTGLTWKIIEKLKPAELKDVDQFGDSMFSTPNMELLLIGARYGNTANASGQIYIYKF